MGKDAVIKGQISNNIRKLRFASDEMTQKELAAKVGVSRQTIVAIEKDHYPPSLALAFMIAHVLGEPFQDVFSYKPAD
ncbi:MAG: transcriptional regulator [Kordiimonadales bacterium]|nr:MAG: transcriptional regulator [Kordiimonadales bacterium]